jgi:hypothetical protein
MASSEPTSRGELHASGAAGFLVRKDFQAVWSAATRPIEHTSSEPDLRGELPATSAELPLVEIALKRCGAKRQEKRKRPAHIG